MLTPAATVKIEKAKYPARRGRESAQMKRVQVNRPGVIGRRLWFNRANFAAFFANAPRWARGEKIG